MRTLTLVSRYLAFLVRMVTLRLSGLSLWSISVTSSGLPISIEYLVYLILLDPMRGQCYLCSLMHQSPVRMSSGA